MQKTLVALILSMLVFPATTLYGAIYELEGQVTAGASLFPPVVKDLSIPLNEFGLPAGGFPVDFEARLELGPEPTDWSFEFVVTDDERTLGYTATNPSEIPGFRGSNNVVLSLDQVTLDFSFFYERLNINLDLVQGTGQWDWAQFCPECDLIYSLPAVTASVTSIRVVPAPSSAILCVMAGVWSLVVLRRYKL